jgi:RHS repeat-associated protein
MPFGMVMPNRNGGEGYRYGYQGSEKDDEVKGSGNSYTTHFRMLDPRIGRWMSIDPEAKRLPWHSPYVSMSDNPIIYTDENGDLFGLDNLIGAAVGALIEVGTQMAVNSITGKDLLDLDYGDIAIEAGVGFVTSGFGNLAKAGKTTMRIVNAAKTAKKVINSNKVVKAAVSVVPEIAKAAVDVTASKGIETVVDGKSISNSAIDLVGGIVGKGAGDLLGKASSAIVNRGSSKAIKELGKQAKRATSNSNLKGMLEGRLTGAKADVKINSKISEESAKVAVGTTVGVKSDNLK